jgi:hypothetical protein
VSCRGDVSCQSFNTSATIRQKRERNSVNEQPIDAVGAAAIGKFIFPTV